MKFRFRFAKLHRKRQPDPPTPAWRNLTSGEGVLPIFNPKQSGPIAVEKEPFEPIFLSEGETSSDDESTTDDDPTRFYDFGRARRRASKKLLQPCDSTPVRSILRRPRNRYLNKRVSYDPRVMAIQAVEETALYGGAVVFLQVPKGMILGVDYSEWTAEMRQRQSEKYPWKPSPDFRRKHKTEVAAMEEKTDGEKPDEEAGTSESETSEPAKDESPESNSGSNASAKGDSEMSESAMSVSVQRKSTSAASRTGASLSEVNGSERFEDGSIWIIRQIPPGAHYVYWTKNDIREGCFFYMHVNEALNFIWVEDCQAFVPFMDSSADELIKYRHICNDYNLLVRSMTYVIGLHDLWTNMSGCISEFYLKMLQAHRPVIESSEVEKFVLKTHGNKGTFLSMRQEKGGYTHCPTRPNKAARPVQKDAAFLEEERALWKKWSAAWTGGNPRYADQAASPDKEQLEDIFQAPLVLHDRVETIDLKDDSAHERLSGHEPVRAIPQEPMCQETDLAESSVSQEEKNASDESDDVPASTDGEQVLGMDTEEDNIERLRDSLYGTNLWLDLGPRFTSKEAVPLYNCINTPADRNDRSANASEGSTEASDRSESAYNYRGTRMTQGQLMGRVQEFLFYAKRRIVVPVSRNTVLPVSQSDSTPCLLKLLSDIREYILRVVRAPPELGTLPAFARFNSQATKSGLTREEVIVLAELQSSYIAFTLGGEWEAFLQWRDLLRLLCNAEIYVGERLIFLDRLFRVVYSQLDQAPENLFAVVGFDKGPSPFIIECLDSLAELMNDKTQTRAWLDELCLSKFGMSLFESWSLQEDAPAVVDDDVIRLSESTEGRA